MERIICFIAAWSFLAVGFIDLKCKRIPNGASYGLLLAGVWYKLWASEINGAMIGMFVAGGLFLLAWLIGVAGGGDVKFIAAAGLWAGWPQVLDVLIYVSILGAAWAIGLWIWTRCDKQRPWGGEIPYGLPIGLGAALVLWGG
jgi:prepilin peptidase CpaA